MLRKGRVGGVTPTDSEAGPRDDSPTKRPKIRTLGVGLALVLLFAVTFLMISNVFSGLAGPGIPLPDDPGNDSGESGSGSAVRSSFFAELQNLSKSTESLLFAVESFPYDVELTSDFLKRAAPFFEHPKKGTIFVSVASYRDPRCSSTVASMFLGASQPNRVFVGIVDQTDSTESECLNEAKEKIPSYYHSHLRTIVVPFSKADGPTYARYLASKLWDGEEFFLMIDSHTCFDKKWDDTLLHRMVKEMPHKLVVFSHYPPAMTQCSGAFDSTDIKKSKGNSVPWICGTTFEKSPDGLFRQMPGVCSNRNTDPRTNLCASPFIGAGFLFARSLLLRDAPFDRYVPFLFHGEELLIGVRLWTRGWDFYAPSVAVVGHEYGRRPVNVFADHPSDWAWKARKSETRARFLMGLIDRDQAPIEFPDDEAELLGVGNFRSMKEFWDFTGVHPNEKTSENRCIEKWNGAKNTWESVFGKS